MENYINRQLIKVFSEAEYARKLQDWQLYKQLLKDFGYLISLKELL